MFNSDVDPWHAMQTQQGIRGSVCSLTPASQFAALQDSLHTALTISWPAGRTMQGVMMQGYLMSYL